MAINGLARCERPNVHYKPSIIIVIASSQCVVITTVVSLHYC